MSDKASRGNARVPVQYHEFDISDEDGPTRPDLERGHGALVRVADGVTIVITGIHTGDVDVTVTLHEKEPALDDSNWQEIVEVSAHSASGDLMVRGMMDELDEELAALSFHRPGDYRLRVHARGRDTAIDLAPDQLTEWYLIQAWPAPAQAARVLRQTDGYSVSVRAR
jgi:hypothetical protein